MRPHLPALAEAAAALLAGPFARAERGAAAAGAAAGALAAAGRLFPGEPLPALLGAAGGAALAAAAEEARQKGPSAKVRRGRGVQVAGVGVWPGRCERGAERLGASSAAAAPKCCPVGGLGVPPAPSAIRRTQSTRQCSGGSRDRMLRLAAAARAHAPDGGAAVCSLCGQLRVAAGAA